MPTANNISLLEAATDAKPRTALPRHSFARMLNNMFVLPSITMTILYLHTSLVFPTKCT